MTVCCQGTWVSDFVSVSFVIRKVMITFRLQSLVSELVFWRNMLPPSSAYKELHPSRDWSYQGEDVFYLCSLVVRDVARQNRGEGLYPPSPSVVLIGHIPYSPPVYLNNILALITCSICLDKNACNPENGGSTFHWTAGVKLQCCAAPQSEQ